MSNELVVNHSFSWEDKTQLAEVRKTFAPTLTEIEFDMFIGLGKSLNLNPYAKEIYAIKFGSKATFVIGRDGYRRNAQKYPDYDYHYAEAIYSNDRYVVKNGIIDHERKCLGAQRGALLGAYCIVKRKSSSRYMYSEVLLTEYDKNANNWTSMKETMIKKVAESQALRMAFQELFSGTNDESEVDTIKANHQNKTDQTEKLKQKIGVKEEQNEIVDAEFVEVTNEPISDNQLSQITDLIAELEFPQARIKKTLDHYKVNDFPELSSGDAENCISMLIKLLAKKDESK